MAEGTGLMPAADITPLLGELRLLISARAAYGKRLLLTLTEQLTAEFGKGFDERKMKKNSAAKWPTTQRKSNCLWT